MNVINKIKSKKTTNASEPTSEPERKPADEPKTSKKSKYTFMVRKGWRLGNVSIFEGRFLHQTARSKISCNSDHVQSEETVKYLHLDGFVEVEPLTYVFEKIELKELEYKTLHTIKI